MSTAAKARMLTVAVEEAPLEEVVTVGVATAVALMPEAERVPALVTVVTAVLKVAEVRLLAALVAVLASALEMVAV